MADDRLVIGQLVVCDTFLDLLPRSIGRATLFEVQDVSTTAGGEPTAFIVGIDEVGYGWAIQAALAPAPPLPKMDDQRAVERWLAQ